MVMPKPVEQFSFQLEMAPFFLACLAPAFPSPLPQIIKKMIRNVWPLPLEKNLSGQSLKPKGNTLFFPSGKNSYRGKFYGKIYW